MAGTLHRTVVPRVPSGDGLHPAQATSKAGVGGIQELLGYGGAEPAHLKKRRKHKNFGIKDICAELAGWLSRETFFSGSDVAEVHAAVESLVPHFSGRTRTLRHLPQRHLGRGGAWLQASLLLQVLRVHSSQKIPQFPCHICRQRSRSRRSTVILE